MRQREKAEGTPSAFGLHPFACRALHHPDAAALLVLLAAAAGARVVAADSGGFADDRLDLDRAFALRLVGRLGHLAAGGGRGAAERVGRRANVLADAVAAGVLVDGGRLLVGAAGLGLADHAG